VSQRGKRTAAWSCDRRTKGGLDIPAVDGVSLTAILAPILACAGSVKSGTRRMRFCVFSDRRSPLVETAPCVVHRRSIKALERRHHRSASLGSAGEPALKAEAPDTSGMEPLERLSAPRTRRPARWPNSTVGAVGGFPWIEDTPPGRQAQAFDGLDGAPRQDRHAQRDGKLILVRASNEGDKEQDGFRDGT
jgi:hypothetical protein